MAASYQYLIMNICRYIEILKKIFVNSYKTYRNIPILVNKFLKTIMTGVSLEIQ